MAFGWQSKLARFSRMEWDEVRVRAGQEFWKRCDLLMYRMGGRSEAIRPIADSAEQRGPRFFSESESSFSQSSAGESSARAEWLCKHLPEEAASILREADEICRHRFRLLGYEDLDFGFRPVRGRENGNGNFAEIDWHLDPVNGKHAPLDPWFKIPFLDFAAVGDHKVIWELNRHQHLVTLAKAMLLSGDEKYTRELMAQWRSWIRANPYPLGINWASTLEVAFRTLSWIWVDQLLAGTTAYAELRAELLPALPFHGRYIERYLSTYFSPNTHLLGEAVALLFLGALYPQFPGARRWRESAWKIVLRESERQVRRDGVYFEQSLHYHVYALDLFLYARLVSTRTGAEIPESYDAVIKRMLDVVEALAQAGPAEGFGDDDGGRLWSGRRNRTEHITDPLALGATMYSREFEAAQLTEEAIWLFGSEAVDALARKRTSPPRHSIAFPDGGLYVLADSEPCAQALVVDSGPQGEGRSGHGHADALSVLLTMDGRRWLVDSGSGVYISRDPDERNRLRGTSAHNTLRVDGADQAVAGEPFSWTQIPTPRAETWICGKTFTYFVGSHDGYTRLADPVVHRRHVLKIAGGVCLLRDAALGQAEHELEILWHFAPDLEIRPQTRSDGVGAGSARVEISRAGARPGESRLSLMVPEGTAWQAGMEVTTAWLSPAYGLLQRGPLVRCSARVMLPAETATVLVTDSGAIKRENEVLTGSARPGVQMYKLDYHGGSYAFFFGLGDEEWGVGPWTSDARVLYCHIDNEKLAQLVGIGGTHVAWEGRPLLKSGETSECFEWRQQDVGMHPAPGEFSATPLFEELANGSLPSLANWNRSFTRSGASSYAEKR